MTPCQTPNGAFEQMKETRGLGSDQEKWEMLNVSERISEDLGA